MKIILPTDTRYFTRHQHALCRTNKVLGKGAEVTIENSILLLWYDHRNQDAVMFRLGQQEYYFLVEDIRIHGLHDKLRKLSKFRVIQAPADSHPTVSKERKNDVRKM